MAKPKNIDGLEAFRKYIPDWVWWINYVLSSLQDDIPDCTGRQRGYIYGMCRKLGYDEHDLPLHISSISEPRTMNIEEAGLAIEALLVEVTEMEEDYFQRYGTKKRYGKKANEAYTLFKK